jgi:putative tryptophan/tyrosine transport system substrate-binding protein
MRVATSSSTRRLAGAAAWPVVVRAQQGERMRRIGMLMPFDENDPLAKPYLSAFMQALADLGWTDGRNVRMDLRWGGDTNRIRALAQELVGLQPDIIVTTLTPATAAVQRETRTIPIVFANVSDPIASGLVAKLNQPGGNITGFAIYQASLGGKWLELLSQIVPRLKRAAIMFGADTVAPALVNAYAPSLEAAVRSLKVVPISAPVRSDVEIETAIIALGREPGGGLVVIPDIFTVGHRAPIISAAARYNVPAVFGVSYFARDGGLLSYGPDPVDIILALPLMSIAFYAARSRGSYPFSFRPNSRWSQTSRPPRRSALPFRAACSSSPTRSSNSGPFAVKNHDRSSTPPKSTSSRTLRRTANVRRGSKTDPLLRARMSPSARCGHCPARTILRLASRAAAPPRRWQPRWRPPRGLLALLSRRGLARAKIRQSATVVDALRGGTPRQGARGTRARLADRIPSLGQERAQLACVGRDRAVAPCHRRERVRVRCGARIRAARLPAVGL